MKKTTTLIFCALFFVSIVSANYDVGDTVEFKVELQQQQGRGYCGGDGSLDLLECNNIGVDESECNALGCIWHSGCDLTCSDDRDIYAAYALKGPSGEIVKYDFGEHCQDTYQIVINYTVDQPGTWKLCATKFGFETYYNGFCGTNQLDCVLESCYHVQVSECNSELDSLNYLDNWLDGW